MSSEKSNVLCIVPARGGSQRIPNKNIRDFFGRPVITYGLHTAADSGLFSHIHVSTDSEQIAAIAEDAGFPVDFLRDSSLADDYTGLVPVYQWVVERYRNEGVDFDAVCTLFPVCPLIGRDDFEASYSIFCRHEGKLPLYTVTPYPVPVEWAYHREDDGRLIPCDTRKFATRSQDIATAYYECGPISWFSPQTLQTLENGPNEGFVSYVLPRSRALDVDNLEDWSFLETVYRGLNSPPRLDVQGRAAPGDVRADRK